MTDNKLVSVIVPIYNGAKYIDRCVNNLLNQTYKNLEIIMINDGSTDETFDRLKELCKTYSNINAINKENSGVSDTRNLGVKMAKGEYVYFFDVDDDLEADTIKDNMELIGDEEVDILYFGFWYHILSENRIKETCIKSDFSGNETAFFNEAFLDLMSEEILNAPWNKLYRRDFLIWNRIEFDTNLSIYEDILFNLKALDAARLIKVNHKAYYHYMIQADGTALTKFHNNNYDSVKKIHKAAIKYISHNGGNEEAINRYNDLFIEQVASYIKQIANKEDLKGNAKNKLIKEIINDKYFVNVINSMDNLKKRKVLLRLFSNHNMVFALKAMYKLTNK